QQIGVRAAQKRLDVLAADAIRLARKPRDDKDRRGDGRAFLSPSLKRHRRSSRAPQYFARSRRGSEGWAFKLSAPSRTIAQHAPLFGDWPVLIDLRAVER